MYCNITVDLNANKNLSIRALMRKEIYSFLLNIAVKSKIQTKLPQQQQNK